MESPGWGVGKVGHPLEQRSRAAREATCLPGRASREGPAGNTRLADSEPRAKAGLQADLPSRLHDVDDILKDTSVPLPERDAIRGLVSAAARLTDHPPVESGDQIETRDHVLTDVRDRLYVADLYNDITVLQATREIVRPLERTGIEEIKFSALDSEEDGSRIELDDVPAFVEPAIRLDDAETIHTGKFDRILGVVSPSFTGDYVWRLTDGDNRISAGMKDAEFLGRVENGRVREFGGVRGSSGPGEFGGSSGEFGDGAQTRRGIGGDRGGDREAGIGDSSRSRSS